MMARVLRGCRPSSTSNPGVGTGSESDPTAVPDGSGLTQWRPTCRVRDQKDDRVTFPLAVTLLLLLIAYN